MTTPVASRVIRVVVADDSPDLRLLLRLALDETDGVTVVGEAADGAEAVALVDAVRPDAVLLDVAMPIMDGLEALQEITRRFGGSVPVVMWSAFSAAHVAQRAAQLGASAYIEKSGDLAPVIAALRQAVLGGEQVAPPPPRTVQGDALPPVAAPPQPDSAAPPVAARPAWTARLGSEAAFLLVSAALFAALFLWRELEASPASGIAALYVAPVALLATQFGARGGLGGAGIATALWLAHAVPDGTGALGHLTRITAYAVVGGTVGWHSDRARRVSAQRGRDEAALVAANRRLAEANRTADAVNAELAASNADLRQFMHVASHDLAEPLRTMGGFAHLARTRHATALDDDGRECLDHIVAGAVRMQLLIDGLSAYTRASQQELDREPVDLSRVLTGVRTALGATIRERQAVVSVPDDLPQVPGDDSMLGLVFQNLVSNALKFNASATPTVRITWRLEGEDAVIDVIDNGIGIDSEHFDRIFELFQRLHGRETYPGTGLGLAICRRIVERHGGSVAVTSAPQAGSTFTVRLPRAAAA